MVFTDQNSLQLKIQIVTFNPFFLGQGYVRDIFLPEQGAHPGMAPLTIPCYCPYSLLFR
jgi:hypothetical protein